MRHNSTRAVLPHGLDGAGELVRPRSEDDGVGVGHLLAIEADGLVVGSGQAYLGLATDGDSDGKAKVRALLLPAGFVGAEL